MSNSSSWSLQLDTNSNSASHSSPPSSDCYEFDQNAEGATYEWFESQSSSKQELVRSIHEQFIENLNKESVQRDKNKLIDVTKTCARDLWRWIEENALDAISENTVFNDANQMLKISNRELQQQNERILCELEQYKQHCADLQHQSSEYLAQNKDLKNAFNAMRHRLTSTMHEFEQNQHLMQQMTIKIDKLKDELIEKNKKLQHFEADNLHLIENNKNLKNDYKLTQKQHTLMIDNIKNQHQREVDDMKTMMHMNHSMIVHSESVNAEIVNSEETEKKIKSENEEIEMKDLEEEMDENDDVTDEETSAHDEIENNQQIAPSNAHNATPDMMHVCSLEDVMIENEKNNVQERDDLHSLFDEKFREYRDDFGKEIEDMMITLNDMKRNGIKIEKEQCQNQIVLVLNEVMNAHYNEMKTCMHSLIASNKHIYDEQSKKLMETQTKYNELFGEYAALSVKAKNEFDSYEQDRRIWRLRIGELLNYIWSQNETKCKMETIQNELICDVKSKENEMKKMSEQMKEKTNLMIQQIEFKQEQILTNQLIGNGFCEIKNALNEIKNEQKKDEMDQIKLLLDKVISFNELERNKNDQIGQKLKDIMDAMMSQQNEAKNGKMSEMKHSLDGLSLLVSSCNEEYKKDYTNLMQIIHKKDDEKCDAFNKFYELLQKNGDEDKERNRYYKEQNVQMNEKLDGIQSLIENGKDKKENLSEIGEKLRGIQSSIEQSNGEYKKDYDQLMKLFNANGLKQNEKRLSEENDQLKSENADILEKYNMLKRILLFLVVFGGVCCLYYIKKKGLHLALMKQSK